MVDLNSLVRQGGDLICANLDGELVMMSIEKGNYYGLEGIGRRIWQLIEMPTKVSALCGALQEEFDVEKSDCEADTLEFLNELAEQGLIEVD